MQPIHIKEILGISWEKFNQRPGLCIGTFLIYVAITFTAGLAEGLIKKIFGFNPHVISILMGAFASFGSTLIMLDLGHNRPTSIGRFFEAVEIYPKGLGQYLLNIFFIFIGLLFLIFPAVIVGLGFSMSLYLILERKAGIIKSFKMSWAMTKGYKWKLFFVSILFLLINFVGAIFLIVGLLVTIPVTALSMVEIYKRLLINHEEKTNQTTPPSGDNACQI